MTMQHAAARYAAVPKGMRDAKRWLLWKLKRAKSGKVLKVPFYANGSARRATDTPEDWAQLATFAEACAALDAAPDRYAGLGFALGPDGTGESWQGIDLDDFPSRPILCELVAQVPGYIEVSPSGRGFHAIGYGAHFRTLGSNSTGIESYSSGRFFTVTGWAFSTSENLECLAACVRDILAPLHGRTPLSTGALACPAPPDLPVEEDVFGDLKDALAWIPPDDRDDWIAMGQALVGLRDRGRELWAEWSAKSHKHKPEEDLQKWSGFKGDRTGYRAVFKLAQEFGWKNPRARPPRPDPSSVGFGRNIVLPPGASLTPLTGSATVLPAAQDLGPPSQAGEWSFGLYDPVADAGLPPITYRDDRKLWPESPGKTVTQLIADPKCHKTNWIMAEAFRLMREGKAQVLMLSLEGGYGVRTMRLKALAGFYSHSLVDLIGRFQIAKVVEGGMFDLSSPACVAAFIAFLEQGNWTDVIIDTQHRAAGSLEENSATDARKLWNAVERIRGCANVNVILVHHKGKDSTKGARGSSADLASVDQQIELNFDRTSMTVTAKVSARKDGVDGFSVPFKVELPFQSSVPIVVPISQDEFEAASGLGDPISAAAISSALRSLECVGGKTCSSEKLAVKILEAHGSPISKDGVDQITTRLTKRASKGHSISMYGRKGGKSRSSPWRWSLPLE